MATWQRVIDAFRELFNRAYWVEVRNAWNAGRQEVREATTENHEEVGLTDDEISRIDEIMRIAQSQERPQRQPGPVELIGNYYRGREMVIRYAPGLQALQASDLASNSLNYNAPSPALPDTVYIQVASEMDVELLYQAGGRLVWWRCGVQISGGPDGGAVVLLERNLLRNPRLPMSHTLPITTPAQVNYLRLCDPEIPAISVNTGPVRITYNRVNRTLQTELDERNAPMALDGQLQSMGLGPSFFRTPLLEDDEAPETPPPPKTQSLNGNGVVRKLRRKKG